MCSGNICRSPMAEVLAPYLADRIGLDVEARSCGTLGLVDREAHVNAVAVCKELGLDLSQHRSQGVSEALLDWADDVLAMEHHHIHHLQSTFPGRADRALPLGQFGPNPEIADPIHGWRPRFRRSRDEIAGCIETFLQQTAG